MADVKQFLMFNKFEYCMYPHTPHQDRRVLFHRVTQRHELIWHKRAARSLSCQSVCVCVDSRASFRASFDQEDFGWLYAFWMVYRSLHTCPCMVLPHWKRLILWVYLYTVFHPDPFDASFQVFMNPLALHDSHAFILSCWLTFYKLVSTTVTKFLALLAVYWE